MFANVARKPVILIGDGPAAAAKRRLLERACAIIAGEEADARLAIVACDDPDETTAAVSRLSARGILVNAVDRPELCDFTIPAIVDRSPVLIAIGTAGVSVGLAAALRQRLETILPARLGRLAEALHAARATLRVRLPDSEARRRAIGAALAEGGMLDVLADNAEKVTDWANGAAAKPSRVERIALASADPDDLTLRQARLLAAADRLCHAGEVPETILNRARADAARIAGDPPDGAAGLTVVVEMAT